MARWEHPSHHVWVDDGTPQYEPVAWTPRRYVLRLLALVAVLLGLGALLVDSVTLAVVAGIVGAPVVVLTPSPRDL